MGCEDKFYLHEVAGAAARLGKGFQDLLNTLLQDCQPCRREHSRSCSATGGPLFSHPPQSQMYFALHLIKQSGFGFTYTI